jgi:hypothetical protein
MESILNAKPIIKDGMRQGLFDIGSENVKYVRYLYGLPKSGKLYKKPDGKTPHRASAPGESPAIWSGQLYQTMNYVVRNYDEMEFGDRPLYGRFLELGTDKMKPRQHLKTAVVVREKDNENLLNRAIDRAIKNHAR